MHVTESFRVRAHVDSDPIPTLVTCASPEDEMTCFFTGVSNESSDLAADISGKARHGT